MLHPSSLDVVAGWKLDEVHLTVKNSITVVVHEDVVLLLNTVRRHQIERQTRHDRNVFQRHPHIILAEQDDVE